MAKTSKGCIVWQWNCRSLAPKRGHLHQYLQSLPPERRPDVLAIQETWKAITIPGYQAFNHTNSSGVVRVTTLVRRNLPAQLHSTGIENIEHTFIEILAGKKKSHRSTFILNVYSPPKARHSFHQLLRAAIDMAKGKALLIVGDFNAPHMYAEANKVFADTMVGFRPKLSTQDVMLRLYHQIMAREYAPKRDTRAILGLDISKAFDNVSHAAILRGLNSIDVGERIFKYIQNFLSSRQVQVSIGGFQSDLQTLGGVGTPQGAVLSPFLFNIAMKDLPTKLQGIPNLHHSIYADDVTLWMVGGSDGAIQDSLQEAIRIVEAYAKERGLACCQEKSELLLMAGTTVKTPSGIILQVGGKDVPRVRRLRILGLWLQEDGKNTYSIGVLRNHAQQVGRLIARIAGKRYGMKERNVIRLIKAFVISRIAYIAPFLDLTLTERDAIDRIIRCPRVPGAGFPSWSHYLGLNEMKSCCVFLGLMFAWILDSTARAYQCSEVTDAVLEQALQCVHKILEPNMTEEFEKSKASKGSGMTDLEYVKKEWEKPCTSEDNSIRRLLVPTQNEDMKPKSIYIVEACLNGTIYSFRREGKL
ncbi:uncharacterized protein ISCGN_008121 [Ixodes scapularis]